MKLKGEDDGHLFVCFETLYGQKGEDERLGAPAGLSWVPD